MKNKLLMLRTSALLIMMFVSLFAILTPTVKALPSLVTITKQISAKWDDAWEYGNNRGVTYSSSYNRVYRYTSDTSSSYRCSGLRFVNMPMVKGDVIYSAYLKVYTTTDVGEDSIYCRIFAHKTSNAPDFQTNTNIISESYRPRTTNYVAWRQASIGYNVWGTSPNLKTVIQEIIDQSTWQSGNAIALLLIADIGALQKFSFYAWDKSTTLCAKLEISYYPTSQLIAVIGNAYSYIDRLYEVDGIYDYVKEYPAFPLGIYVQQTGKYFLIGADYEPPISIIQTIEQTSTYDHFLIYFEDEEGGSYNFELDVDRYYYTDGSTKYMVTFSKYTGSYTIDLYLGDDKIISNITSSTGVTVVEKWKYNYQCYPSHRYTVRHGAQLSSLIYHIWGTKWSGQYLDNLINDFGFTYDIYDPMFFESVDESTSFMFSSQAYHDCDVYGDLPRGMNPHRYPYRSKVMINREAYITASYNDPLLRGLWAIHILNKYHDPDLQFSTSARDTARWIEANYWNGYGISVPLKDPQYASGVRSAVFLVLETLLGYKYGDTTSKSYADTMANVMVKVQWRSDGYGETADLGVILRNPHAGGFLLSWKTGTSYPYAVAPKGILEEIIDMFEMPHEDVGVVPTNLETTATCLQALRVFLYYKYGVAYPNASYIP